MPLDAERGRRVGKRLRDCFEVRSPKADAFRRGGAPGRIGHLDRAGGKSGAGRCIELAAEHREPRPPGDSADPPPGEQSAELRGVVGEYAVDSRIVERVLDLRRREIARQRHRRQLPQVQREVRERPADSVVRQQREALAARGQPVALLVEQRSEFAESHDPAAVVEGDSIWLGCAQRDVQRASGHARRRRSPGYAGCREGSRRTREDPYRNSGPTRPRHSPRARHRRARAR